MAELIGPRWGPASKATPKQLVVLCHGVGADGHDLIDLAPTWSHAVPDALFVSVDAPFPHDFLEGARGVQLAELGLKSWHERRWIDVPELAS